MKIKMAAAILSLVFILSNTGRAEWVLDLEGARVYCGYNDVRIPNEGGTEFSLTDDFDLEPEFEFRLRLSYVLNDKHTFSVFAAPLRLDAYGTASGDIFFEDTTFASGTDIKGIYRFDSYRLTYRYRFYDSDKLEFGAGFTAKIRDAAISLESDSVFAEKTNVGFVPLLNFRLNWLFADRFSLLFQGDALAAPQGRAEDVILALVYSPSEHISLRGGYRILEGGADVDEVYNFALLHYVSTAVVLTF